MSTNVKRVAVETRRRRSRLVPTRSNGRAPGDECDPDGRPQRPEHVVRRERQDNIEEQEAGERVRTAFYGSSGLLGQGASDDGDQMLGVAFR